MRMSDWSSDVCSSDLMVAERARVMLLEKAFLRAALRAANEADRAARGVRQHHGRDRCVVIGKVALGRLDFGKDHAVAAADLDVALGRRGGLLLFGRHVDRKSVV